MTEWTNRPVDLSGMFEEAEKYEAERKAKGLPPLEMKPTLAQKKKARKKAERAKLKEGEKHD